MSRIKRVKIFSFLEKKSKNFALVIEILITVSFVSVILLLSFLSFSMVRLADLELENSTERAFNAVIMALRDQESAMDEVLSSYDINGVAIYSASGNLLYSRGNVYQRLPVSLFSSSERNSMTSSLLSFNRSESVVEYIRASRDAVIPQSGSTLLPINSISLSYPNIIYLNMDASSYAAELVRLRVIFFILILITIAIYIIVLYVYRQNRKYKELLVRQESLVSLGEAARTLTHEIKNPLSAIKIQIAILKRELIGDQLDGIYTIEHETNRLRELTDKVSDFLRNPLGKPEVLDVVKEVKELYPLFRYEIKTAPFSLSSALVFFDKDRMRSVFENIIKNAIEATKEGCEPDVTISFKRNKKGFVEVCVLDRGSGFDAKDQKKIFDPFFTTKIHGSGIGLSIAMQFIKASGGMIKIENREGGGASVKVLLKEVKR